jgi:exodeoxyribonuclease V alpha subunit
LINYLSGEKFPGIGKKTAEKIVTLLGEQAIDRMLEEPASIGTNTRLK